MNAMHHQTCIFMCISLPLVLFPCKALGRCRMLLLYIGDVLLEIHYDNASLIELFIGRLLIINHNHKFLLLRMQYHFML